MRERDHRRVHAPLSSRMERSCARGVEDACMIMHECGRRTRQLCSNASLTSRGVGRRFSQCSCVPSFLHAPTSVSPRGRMASHIPSFCRCALLARRRAHVQHAAMPPRRAPARRCVLRALTRRARTTSSCHGLRFERGGDGEAVTERNQPEHQPWCHHMYMGHHPWCHAHHPWSHLLCEEVG